MGQQFGPFFFLLVASICTTPLPAIPTKFDPESGLTVVGTATTTNLGSFHGSVCPGSTEGVDAGLTAEVVGSCGTVSFRQTDNHDGHAEFEIVVVNDTVPVNTVGMTVVFSSIPTDTPSIVRLSIFIN